MITTESLDELREAQQRIDSLNQARLTEHRTRAALILRLRSSSSWNRKSISQLLGLDPRSLDRLVREARAGRVEDR